MPVIRFSIPNRDEQAVTINPKRDSLTLTVNQLSIVTFDRTGRWLGAFLDGRNYKRGADDRVMEKWAEHENGFKIRRRRDLTGKEKDALVTRLYGLAEHVLEAMRSNRLTRPPDGTSDRAVWTSAEQWLCRATAWDSNKLRDDRRRFLRVYKPITILPPDQYRAVVLQITEGCTYNRCTFCSFYRDRPFRVKALNEVRAHIADVKAFFGETLALRHVIFLADANALVSPTEHLLPVFDLIDQSFDLIPPNLPAEEQLAWRRAHPCWVRGIYSFLDVFTGHHKRVGDFRALRERGLQRVYIGLETGDPELLRFLNKPGSPEEAQELVAMIKAAGLHVGIIVMAGVGGDKFARSHVEKTVQVVNGLGLGMNDLVYLSEFVEYPASEYTGRARAARIRPLSARETRAQMDEMRSGFRFDGHNRPKVAIYDIQEFIY
jgi:radical SAM superfamily enzyme YgiQ (UPF0313 family)